ncbi:hypothetical protein QEH56_19995 [Pelagicoccus enzymogenes]|uniref:hypothetical protein n=1 Tax=Pelagicoccus enzymogenes TaxID=2773457 RepID=UPI00280CB5A2|nr:hypothetical protein [Pelagicoccus enzymogenes]MDQ8200458.1 hypothetical protein [Pelagicoccus enzymogenes]
MSKKSAQVYKLCLRFLGILFLLGAACHFSLGGTLPAEGTLSRTEGLPGFYIWTVSVPVEPNLAYRVDWATDLRDGFTGGEPEFGENFGEDVSSSMMVDKRRPVFARISYVPAFAPRLVSEEVLQQLWIELEDELVLSPRPEENRFYGSYVEVEDGLEMSFFFGIAYDRTDLNAGEIRFDLGSVRLRDLATGETVDTDIWQLALLVEQALPVAVRGAIEFRGPESGTIVFKTVYSDESEGDFNETSF